MENEVATVSLTGPDGDRAFGIEHAENLLKFQLEKGLDDYKLPDNSTHEFIDGALRRRSKRSTNKPQKSNG